MSIYVVAVYLHGIFEYAVRYYGLNRNPVDSIEEFVKTAEEKQRKTTIYSPEEFGVFIAAMPDDDYKLLYQYIYWLGLRRQEALSLVFSDISEDGVLHLHRQYDQDLKEWTKLKTESSERYIQLPAFLLDIYIAQLAKYSSAPGFTNDWFLFGGYDTLKRTTMDRRKRNAIKQAGLPYIKNHELRHSYVSNMLAVEQNVFLVSRSVGHTNTDMTTGTYGHLAGGVSDFSKEIEEIYEQMQPKMSA